MATKSTTIKLILKITSFILRSLLNIVFYVLVITLIITASKKAYTFSYQLFGQVAVDEEPGIDKIFRIKKGEATMDIASKLKVNRLIVDKNSFYFKAKLKKYTIMPGQYKLNTSMTYDEIFDIITDYSASMIQEEDVLEEKAVDEPTEEPTEESAEDPVEVPAEE